MAYHDIHGTQCSWGEAQPLLAAEAVILCHHSSLWWMQHHWICNQIQPTSVQHYRHFPIQGRSPDILLRDLSRWLVRGYGLPEVRTDDKHSSESACHGGSAQPLLHVYCWSQTASWRKNTITCIRNKTTSAYRLKIMSLRNFNLFKMQSIIAVIKS